MVVNHFLQYCVEVIPPYTRLHHNDVITEINRENPGPVDNADADFELGQAAFEIGAEVGYVCRTGYELASGDGRITCDEAGEWTELPSCQGSNNGCVCQKPPYTR